jgi:hypothetical protein
MKPEVDQILGLSTAQLMGTIVPLLPTSFAQGSAALMGFMLMFAAQEYDRAADIRVAENGDMRRLFRDAAPTIADAELKAALLRAADTRDDSLKVSMLDVANGGLRRVLIRLQEHAEDNALRDLERRIWDVLKASAERRLLKLA